MLCSQQIILGRAAVQKDLGRMEKQACRYFVKSNTGAVSYMWDGLTLCTNTVWGFGGEVLGITVNRKSTISQQ